MGRAENIVEGYLDSRCKELGLECRKVKWINRRGAPDRLVMSPIWPAVWVETKAKYGRLDGHQEREISRMRRMKQTVYVVYTRQMVDDMFDDIEEKYLGS